MNNGVIRPNPPRRRNIAPCASLLLSLFALDGYAQTTPYYQQILDRLQTDTDVILPWQPQVQDILMMHNRETPIPPQCYTDTGGVHNPCYVCHQDALPGRENTMNDRDLQEAYSFSDAGLTNHWYNLFEDRSARVAQISDQDILTYINQDNYSTLPARLASVNFQGWIPDLDNLENGAAAFDANGFALDGSWWVAFKYKPLPSTFWPTQGSTDDVMIRLPAAFYSDAQGNPSLDVYKANLALLEANIKGVASISALAFDENAIGTDLNGDGQLTANVTSVSASREHYVGGAGDIDLIPHVYPQGTEFLHTVRYVGVDNAGNVFIPKRMKEVRYMKRRIQSRHFQLAHYYLEEIQEKEEGNLPTYINHGQDGLGSDFGWQVTGFLENKEGNLRWNTFEENVFCMGCHTTIGSTIDKTFSFPRKIDGAAGWGYINLKGMPEVPSMGESQGEILTYLQRVGGGTEFRSNPELEARFYHPDGSVNLIAVASAKDVYDFLVPSRARALQLNKAYRVIVQDQDFIYGRDATVTPPTRVLQSVDNQTSPTLPAQRQHDWNILLDWSQAATNQCHYRGDVDFSALTVPHQVMLAGTDPADHDRVCAAGTVNLAGTLNVALADGFTPAVGDQFEIVAAGQITGDFSTVNLPSVPGLTFSVEKTPQSYNIVVIDAVAGLDEDIPMPLYASVLLAGSLITLAARRFNSGY